MRAIITIVLFNLLAFVNLCAQETITISGRVTDFDGCPIDSCRVSILCSDFSEAYFALSGADGNYSIPGIEKGKYMAIYALRPAEYPRSMKVAPENMRLEFWAWNVIADRDLTINPRYDRLELYGTTVFQESGGYPEMIIYTRPMSLGRMLAYEYEKDTYSDKNKSENEQVDISVEPDEIEFKVFADDLPIKVLSVQPVEEYIGGGRMMAYLLYVELPANRPEKYCVFRVEAHSRAYGGERGENVYFYETHKYNL